MAAVGFVSAGKGSSSRWSQCQQLEDTEICGKNLCHRMGEKWVTVEKWQAKREMHTHKNRNVLRRVIDNGDTKVKSLTLI